MNEIDYLLVIHVQQLIHLIYYSKNLRINLNKYNKNYF